MRWVSRKSGEYLLRKINKQEKSLGPRSADTARIIEAFEKGRAENTDRLQGLAQRLNELAPINRAMGLGRIPKIAARIIRAYDELDLVGKQILIVGTNAMFAYEAAAGVHFSSDLLATGDVDLLLDARRQLRLAAVDRTVSENGLFGVLRRVDTSFATRGRGDFRASNRDGYLVDLICPQPKDPLREAPNRLTDAVDDFVAAEIKGLAWLANAPRYSECVIDDDGFPVQIATIDPRVFALHKAWLAEQDDRSALKRHRDRSQAEAVGEMSKKYLNLSFDSHQLAVLPAAIRRLSDRLVPKPSSEPIEIKRSTRPDW